MSSNPTSQERFGASVSVFGTTAVIGASNADDLGANSGATYVFRDSHIGWKEQAKMIPSDGEGNDFFGNSVVADRTNIAVGSLFADRYGMDTGAVYLTSTFAISSSTIRYDDEQVLFPVNQ